MYLDILHRGLTRWIKYWGDPVVLGSAITSVFALAAALSVALAVNTSGRERFFWIVIAFAAVLFAANVHLDIQILTNSLVRCATQALGWYDQRETVRGAFLAGVLLSAGILAAVLLWVFRRQILPNPLVLLGVGLMAVMQGLKGVGWKGLVHVNRI